MECLILGDSISDGIGSRKINYVSRLSKLLGDKYEFINLAKTGTTIEYALNILPEILKKNVNSVIIMYGSVDAQIRPNLQRNRLGLCHLIPARYKIGGMLSPRAFYSKKWYRILPDRLDNLIRVLLKNFVLLTQGKTQWVEINKFKEKYEQLIMKLQTNGIDKIILVSTVYLDNSYFLDSNIEYCKYNAVIKRVAEKNGLDFVDLYPIQKFKVKQSGWDSIYSKDHFHPNEAGYDLIAREIAKCLRKD